MLKKISYIIISAFTFFSCSIENDIPYPIVDGSITDMEVENQIAANGSSDSKAVIDKNKRTVSLVVDDGVDIRKLRITKLTVTNDAVISIDTTLCNNPSKFPTNGFESLDELMLSADTRADFSNPVKLTLTTYQNYEWTINVQQYIERVVNVENQVDAIIDEINKSVVIYVAEDQDLSKIKVTEFNLAGKHGTVNLGLSIFAIFFMRFLLEFTKENQMSFEDSLSLNMGQILSIPFVLIGIILIAKNVIIVRKRGNA